MLLAVCGLVVGLSLAAAAAATADSCAGVASLAGGPCSYVYDECGAVASSPLVVFVHDTPGSMSDFQGLLMTYRSRPSRPFRWLSFDLFDASDANGTVSDAQVVQIHNMIRFVDEPNHDKAPLVIVGVGTGAILSSAFALAYPRRIDGIVLVSPAGIPVNRHHRPWNPAVVAISKLNDLAANEHIQSTSLVATSAAAHVVLRCLDSLARRHLLPEAALAYVEDVVSHLRGTLVSRIHDFKRSRLCTVQFKDRSDVFARLASLDVPTSIVVGWWDTVVPSTSVRTMQQSSMPNASLVVVDKAGRNVVDDAPGRVLDVVDDVIRQIGDIREQELEALLESVLRDWV
ncbi:Serine aminopeptidase S33 domain-containing protein [Plasmodiophora brassicae]|uniref:Serine aminopeptidase S33 domain-containing protein n=1 Tax=Plasmodiophora brassicae TaxID=37360 RepID=A0A0G4IZ56_PLABS|nr:hypothetical protein PBRA_001463 [Plasmodiophora brassicae]SPQ94085.1 unnamed protein product [Plasmodiophora brassicae]